MTLISMLKASAARLARYGTGLAVTGALLLGPALPAQAADGHAHNPGPALWVVRDADSTIYLFGTVHMLRPETQWQTPEVTAALNSADELWLELEDPNDAAAATPIIQQYGVSPDRPLSSLLTAEELAQLDAAARTIGATAAALDPLRPWLAGLTLSVAPVVAAGYDPNSGVDNVLRAQALAAGKPVRGLETLEQQIRFFATLPEDQQLDFLRSTLAEFDQATVLLDQMATNWANGDPEGLYTVAGAPMRAEARELYDVILTNRNTDWADQIQAELNDSGTVFIAVGALHLAGPESVQAILESRGVAVERQ